MKVAQLTATIPDILPPEYSNKLAELQSNAPPMGGIFVKRRMITEYAKKLYFTYSIILDTILILGIIVAFLNLEKLIKVFSW